MNTSARKSIVLGTRSYFCFVSWSLRQSSVADADWIAELRADVLEHDLRRLRRFDPDRVRRRFWDAFEPDCTTQVIVIDDDDAGCIAVRETVDSKWIEHFYVGRVHQGRGIGSAVLQTILSASDSQPLRLNVLQGSSARRLYERCGFVMEREDPVDVYMVRHSFTQRRNVEALARDSAPCESPRSPLVPSDDPK
jgi:GNAT superfamily N-acetyltransferase